ncbi:MULTISPECIES: hypothetical protein [Streptomyces]|uniref:Uncharacterized protein n=1 Tax=Streptomyces flavovirens TaxID=52258 RepID=A0ABV8MYJ8_9ACTN|nr:hypothetical protein [Streptomyces sp. MBT51]
MPVHQAVAEDVVRIADTQRHAGHADVLRELMLERVAREAGRQA